MEVKVIIRKEKHKNSKEEYNYIKYNIYNGQYLKITSEYIYHE